MNHAITAPITLVRESVTAPITLLNESITSPIEMAADAYNLAQREGFVGTRAEWLASLVGPAGSSYIHEQLTPSAVWGIAHNLGKYPAHSIMDSSGRLVGGDVRHLSINQSEITFSAAFSGRASLT